MYSSEKISTKRAIKFTKNQHHQCQRIKEKTKLIGFFIERKPIECQMVMRIMEILKKKINRKSKV